MWFCRNYLCRHKRIIQDVSSRPAYVPKARGHEWRHEPTDTHARMHACTRSSGRIRMMERNTMYTSARCVRENVFANANPKPRSISIRLQRPNERLSHQISSPLEILHNDALYLRVICVQHGLTSAHTH